MARQSTAGLIGITTLSVFMIFFSFLFNQYGEPNISLILLFAGLLLAVVLVVIVVLERDSENN